MQTHQRKRLLNILCYVETVLQIQYQNSALDINFNCILLGKCKFRFAKLIRFKLAQDTLIYNSVTYKAHILSLYLYP
jgi:hypothetical protein